MRVNDVMFQPRSLRAAGMGVGVAVFRLPESGETARAQAVAPAAAAATLEKTREAERRRRALREGRGLLDGLDQVKIGMLQGQAGAALRQLAGRLAGQPEFSGDPALDDVLAHIRLRAEVEMAKEEVRAKGTTLTSSSAQARDDS